MAGNRACEQSAPMPLTIDKETLCSWGANNCGQLGVGNTDDQLVPNVQCNLDFSFLGKLKKIGGGGGFSFILLDTGQLLTCGNNDKGQIGQDRKDGDMFRTTFHPLPYLPLNVKINKVTAGWDFMVVVTDDQIALSWGSNYFGQLGRTLPSGQNWDVTPGQITFPSGHIVCDVSAGLRHALSVTENSHVFSWGCGRKGQLGVCENAGKHLQRAAAPVRVLLPEDENANSVFTGMYNSGALTATGCVFLWGCNKYGQCGMDKGQATNVHLPIKVKINLSSKGEKVVNVTCGWSHCQATSSSGCVYSWGRGDLGQLGRPCDTDRKWDNLPQLVPGLANIKKIICGSEHNLCLDREHKVFSWGWNEHGICGSGDERNVHQPMQISSLSSEQISDIACGAGHSFCVVSHNYSK